jgi:hypothetical protein
MKFRDGSPWPEMPARHWKALGEYTRWLANEVGLRDWMLHFDHEPLATDSGHAAEIRTIYGQRDSTISLKRSWAADALRDPSQARQTLLHELIHAHFDIHVRFVTEDLKRVMGQLAHGPFCATFERAAELAIDNISAAWAQHIPLPYPLDGLTPPRRRAHRKRRK